MSPLRRGTLQGASFPLTALLVSVASACGDAAPPADARLEDVPRVEDLPRPPDVARAEDAGVDSAADAPATADAPSGMDTPATPDLPAADVAATLDTPPSRDAPAEVSADVGTSSPQLAFPGAEGFGARAEGGRGGTTLLVTNLNDSGPGSLRAAVERAGRRVVQFAVHGVIQLRSPLTVREPYLTLDGRGALDPGEAGITLRDHSFNINTHDVIVRYLRVRLGDYAVARRVITARDRRPAGSDDLDCINIDNARDVILDHVSASWSADEVISVTRSHNVTVQWSIVSEPLGGLRDGIYIHPYGDNHQYCANNSAATLTYHHNLFAHFRFRGPQFEPNDAAAWRAPDNPSFEAVNNVVYGYTDSGSRFRHGFELASDRNARAQYLFHFVGNRYLDPSGNETEIHAAVDMGVEPNIRAYFRDNLGPHRGPSDPQTALVFTSTNARDPIRSNAAAMRQVSATPLFTSTVPVTTQPADVARDAVFASAGCDLQRDVIDQRVVSDARAGRPALLRVTQEGLPGGWPSYHP